MEVVQTVNVLHVVVADEAEYCAFDASPWVDRVLWQVEVQIHGLLIGL